MFAFSRSVWALALFVVTAVHAAEWPDYGGSPDQSKFAVPPDITRKNVAQLEVPWTYPTSDERAYQFNPVIVDSVMYVLAKNSSLVAIDVVTRKELWIHANLRGITNRITGVLMNPTTGAGTVVREFSVVN